MRQRDIIFKFRLSFHITASHLNIATLALSSWRKSSTRVRRYWTVWSLLMCPSRLYKVLAHCCGTSFATLKWTVLKKLGHFFHLVPAGLISTVQSWYDREIFLADHLRPGSKWVCVCIAHDFELLSQRSTLTANSSASWRAVPGPRRRVAEERWWLRYSGLQWGADYYYLAGTNLELSQGIMLISI